MIRQTGLVLLALLGCSAPSVSSSADNRIRTWRYEPDQIVTVPGKSGIQSTIEFGSDEHIESVAVGDSAAWQVTPNRHASLLFVKPLVASSRTNMTVVTDQRTYLFDLVAGRHEGAPIYVLKFSYPEDLAAKAKLEQVRVVAPTPAPPAPVRLNFAWKTKGVGFLLPARVFDDGTSVFLAWTHDVPLPAVSTLTADGKEASLNYRVAGDYLVVTPVPDNIVLRYGKKTATASRILSRGGREVLLGAETPAVPSSPMPAAAPAPTAAPPREPIARPQVATVNSTPEQPAAPGDKARLTAAQQ
jgi:type IV secretion system protein VirB9